MKTNRKKFKIAGTLIIVIVVGIVGVVGWLVYDHQDSKNKETPSITQPDQAPLTDQTNQEVNASSYLIIKEWDMQFSVPSQIQDLTYDDYGNSEGLEWVRLTSPSLEAEGKLKSVGPETQEKIGLLYRAEIGLKSGLDACDTNEDCAIRNAWAHKTVGDYFYYYDPTHSSDDFIDSSYRKLIDNSIDTLSPIN